jgi:hypothetical protein
VDDLSGKSVYARKDGKYYDSLVALNAALKAMGRARQFQPDAASCRPGLQMPGRHATLASGPLVCSHR